MNIRRKRKLSEVNIVPLVDVLTVLIFFFLLTMQFKEIHAVDITPPKMESSTNVSESNPITISITQDGKYFLKDEEISLEKLKAQIKDMPETQEGLILLADKKTNLEYITNIYDVVLLSKVKKLRLQTKTD